MSSQQQYKKPDTWALRAAREGYPARSVYKLKELDERFSLLAHRRRVLDLGAAPGSWTMFAAEKLKSTGKIVALDLKPLTKISDIAIVTKLQGDMTSPEIVAAVTALGPYDTILSDAAPDTTGNRLVDTLRSENLLEFALFYADTVLGAGGNFAAKLFQGSDLGRVLQRMRTLFLDAKTFKPKACRSSSFETYLVGLGKR